MSTVRMLRNGQLTLPVRIRQSLALEEGAFLGAEVRNNRIILIPKRLVEKDVAKERIFEIVKRIWGRNKNLSEKEVGEEVSEAIRIARGQEGR